MAIPDLLPLVEESVSSAEVVEDGLYSRFQAAAASEDDTQQEDFTKLWQKMNLNADFHMNPESRPEVEADFGPALNILEKMAPSFSLHQLL